MKKFVLAIAGLAVVSIAAMAWTGANDKEPLAIGSPAPMTDVAMADVSDKEYTLAGVKGDNGLLVIFSCNTCPWVKRWEDRYLSVAKLAREKGIGVIAVNSNADQRADEESLAAMKARATERGYTFPYVVDEDNKLADAFGATRTPDVFLFDKNLILVYRGAIDDNARDAAAVEEPFLVNAINQMAAGQEITQKETKAIGCTIKRKRA